MAGGSRVGGGFIRQLELKEFTDYSNRIESDIRGGDRMDLTLLMTEIKGSKLKVSFGALTDMDAGVHNWSSTSGVTGNVFGYPVVFDIQYCYIYIYINPNP